MITFKDIAIGYKEVLFTIPAMTLEPGQLITLIGPNGSGKTTLLNTILGLQEPFSGGLLFNGKAIKAFSKIEKTKLISRVSSKFEGVNYLSIYDLIALGRAPYTNMLNVLTDSDKTVIYRVLKELDLEDIAHKSTTEISDGERQIAMIGKALAQETEIIILDEPTAFLDYNNRRKVLRILKTIAKNQGKLILLTSHDLELCFESSDRIIGIDEKGKTLKIYTNTEQKSDIIQEIFGEK